MNFIVCTSHALKFEVLLQPNFGQICLGERSVLINQNNSNVRTLGHTIDFITATEASVATETTTTKITIFLFIDMLNQPLNDKL